MLWFYQWFFPGLWMVFLVYWQIKAGNTKATVRLEGPLSRIVRSILFLAAIALMSLWNLPEPFLYRAFVAQGYASFFTGVVVAVAGILFAVWAREHLGRNWSRSVTLKQDHELITSGPYAVVRHPIYTGILTGFLGTVIAEGQVRSLIALLLVSIALCVKLRLEEQWMRLHFGDAYGAYAQRVAALVPFVL
jgi:protein-S-isoprenylcysteine O-methyltransferase Ste14